MTRWAFTAGAVAPLGDEPVALVLAVMETDTAGGVRWQRQRWRRQVLAILAGNALGMTQKAVALVAGFDGIRRLDGLDVYASVAHRGGWVAAALSRTPVGIDLEQPEEADAACDVVVAGVDEIDLVAWCGLAGIWATREAVLKAQGRDLIRNHRHWHFGDGEVRGDDGPFLRVDLAARTGIVAAVAYVGD